MNKLAKWLPFLFRRKKRPQRGDNTPSSTTPARVQPTRAPTASLASNRVFDTMMSDRFWRDPFAVFGEMTQAFAPPRVDVTDERKHVRVTAELPGVARNNFDVAVHNGVLVLRGETNTHSESSDNGWYRSERHVGQFQRAVSLPRGIDISRAQAKFNNGLLTIRFSKTDHGGSVRSISFG